MRQLLEFILQLQLFEQVHFVLLHFLLMNRCHSSLAPFSLRDEFIPKILFVIMTILLMFSLCVKTNVCHL